MIEIAKTASWLGAALLLLGLLAGMGALLIFSMMGLVKAFSGNPKLLESEPIQGTSDSGGIFASWLAWLVFAVITTIAFFGELFTRYSTAGFGFIYITLGMPVFLVAWLGLNVCASVRFVPTRWLFGTLAAAGLIVLGYGNIN